MVIGWGYQEHYDKRVIHCGCVRTEGTGICLYQGQSKWQEAVENCVMRSCIICTACKVLEKMKQGFKDGWVMLLASENRENT
jgi:hypothetical protein